MSDPDWRGESESADALAHIPLAPRNPSARARALIYRYQGAQFVMLLVGGIFLSVGSILGLVFSWGAWGDVALARSPRQVTGHVIDERLNYSVTVNGRHPTLIRFRYSDGDAEETGESSTLDPSLIAAAIAGAEIPVEVSQGYARIRGTWYASFGPWGLLSLILPLIGAFLSLSAIRSRRRNVRAFTDGKPITAQVTESGPNYSVRINGRNPLQVKWAFEVAGERFEGSISSLDASLMQDLMSQKSLTVLYDPMNPSVNTVWIS